MANVNPPDVSRVVADPKRPWKAWAASIVALIGLLWANLAGRDSLDNLTLMEWLTIIVPTVLTWATTYLVENPKIVKTS